MSQNGHSNRTTQGQYKDFEEEAEAPQSGATPSTPAPNQSAPVLKACWEVLGLTMPIGGVVFQGEWESFYDQHPNADVHLVDVMESFIQMKLTRGQKGIPPKFYELKHEQERLHKEMIEEIDEARRWAAENPQRWAEANQRFEEDLERRKLTLQETSGQVIVVAPMPALPERAGQSKQSKELTPERQALAERNILAIILRDPGALEQHPEIRKLEAGHFYADERHQMIFAGMKDMRRFGKALTVDALIECLRGRGDLERAGGEAYVRALVDVDVAPARKATA